MTKYFPFLTLFIFITGVPLAGASLEEILKASLAADQRNEEKLKNLIFHEKILVQRLDKTGKVIKETTSNYLVITERGLSYQLAKDDHSGEQVLVTGRVFDFSPTPTSTKHVKSNPEKGAPKQVVNQPQLYSESMDMTELVERYDLRLTGRESVDGRMAWILEFEPRKNIRHHSRVQKILNNMKGRLWLDQESHAILRCEASLAKAISLAWPFATLRSATLSYRAQRLPSGAWVPEKLVLTTTARSFLNTTTQRQTATMYNFRKLKPAARE
ncbi:MAG: hypothetical protein SFY92_08610 [Verrucomicrobiae bacterium]|nr:hypothetical protein [Verrucomicrobiae bacterium]